MGQSFLFMHINSDIIVTTPEYLPPEVLENTSTHHTHYDFVNKLNNWSIDVWSLGAVLLEIALGFPIWLSYRGRIVCKIINEYGENDEVKSDITTGLFGVTGRESHKIVKLQ